MILIRAAAATALIAVFSACGSGGGPPSDRGGAQRYHGSFIVLESPDHGPALCNSVRESLPPQCGGIPITGWDWTVVEGLQRLDGTTWGRWHVTGTFDGAAFTLTEPPGAAEDQPDDRAGVGTGPTPGGAKLERRLTAIQDELLTSHVRDVLGPVDYSYADPQRGVLVVGVWLPDTAAQRFAKERWGDLVQLRSLLKRVR